MTPVEQIARAVDDAGVVLTANQRLSRTLRKAYDDRQRSAGLTAWISPAILPLSTWLEARFSDAQLSGRTARRVLLTASQELVLWRRIVEQSGEAASLLDVRGTAESAMQAWRLVHQYRLPLDGRYSAQEDCLAFQTWAAEYARICRQQNWLDSARLPDAIADSAHAFDVPKRILLAGFDEFTPQQTAVLDALGCPRETIEPESVPGATLARPCRDADDELVTAARWARDMLRIGGRRTIGIVLLERAGSRSRLERIFHNTLDSYHISIPDPLSDYPLVAAALRILRNAGLPRWRTADASLLLRSPFLAGGHDEASARALLDVAIRRRRRLFVPVDVVASLGTKCPEFSNVLERWRLAVQNLRGSRKPSDWSDRFLDLLDAAGWPGDRVLSSAEYQVFEAFTAAIREFATLDVTAHPLTYGEAVSRFGDLCRDTQFQPQDPGAAIQILGPLEAAGARFDALWICGATDRTWPAPSHPHPFIPLSLQREHDLPHSSADREREFAARIFARLQASAADVVVSWAERDGDVELRPSPIVAPLARSEEQVPPEPEREPMELEYIQDEMGPPLANLQPRGGTRVVKLQAACPFQAFADLRLGARKMDVPEPGLSASDRGSAIHKALQLFWEEVRDHSTLTQHAAGVLRAIAERAAISAVRSVLRDSGDEFDAEFSKLEIKRLTQVLVDWAEFEKQRSPFTVAFSERERTIRIGGLELRARIDRVDEIPGGRHVILDYKATAPSPSAWEGPRPDEPQVPLYAISNEAAVAGLAFAQVGPDGLRFKGYTDTANVMPGIKPAELGPHIEAWRAALEPLADSFRRGEAQVDPVKGTATCEFCGLQPLCRIHELPQEDSDAGA